MYIYNSPVQTLLGLFADSPFRRVISDGGVVDLLGGLVIRRVVALGFAIAAVVICAVVVVVGRW